MALSVTRSDIIFSTNLNFINLPVVIHDGTADAVSLYLFSQGEQLNGVQIVKDDGIIRLPRKLLPPFLTFYGQALDDTSYIAINVDLFNSVVFNLYVAAESGGGGGETGDDYRLAGVVKVNGVPTQRDVIIVSDDAGNRQIVGEGESAGDGSFDLTYSGWDGAVIVVALDEYGIAFAASAPINAGTVVHPTAPNGYVYVVTEAGTTGATEPAWATSGSVVSGSVTFTPRPYYRPAASGPLQGELVE